MREVKYDNTIIKYYVANDGKSLAMHHPKTEEKWIVTKAGRKIRTQRASEEILYINTYRTRYGGEWWEKSYLERIKPEYKEELEELIKMYPNACLSEYSDV